MYNPYETQPAKITFISRQTANVKLFRFEFIQKVTGWKFTFKPGQFIELSLPGFGEAPFAPCQDPKEKYLELCVRSAGKLTTRLHQMKIGDKINISGPYGNGAWPLDKYNFKTQKNLFIAVGGLGLGPFPTLFFWKDNLLGRDNKVQIFYGARHPDEMLFRHEYGQWKKHNIQIELTVDKECSDWSGCVGAGTTLFD